MSGSENSMAEPRPAASLTASLLARRGAARPAMRRQPIANLNAPVPINDDLGWNDMGEDQFVEPEAVTTPVPVSPINEQLQELAERIKARPAPRSSAAQMLPLSAGRKAAFTLRLDSERHLRLRLLSAVSNRSAQQLLTEALDEIISRNDELRELADKVETGKAKARTKRGA